MSVLEMNEGARRENDRMHQRNLERQQEFINEKLDKIIELLESSLAQSNKAMQSTP